MDLMFLGFSGTTRALAGRYTRAPIGGKRTLMKQAAGWDLMSPCGTSVHPRHILCPHPPKGLSWADPGMIKIALGKKVNLPEAGSTRRQWEICSLISSCGIYKGSLERGPYLSSGNMLFVSRGHFMFG